MDDKAGGRQPVGRSIGLVFAAAAAIVALVWWRDGAVLSAALAVAAALLAVSFAVPRLLRPLNLVCCEAAMRLGRMLNR